MQMAQYKHKLILFCKSYRGDIDRAEVLYKSILQHNKENIPFYLSIPSSDESLFRERLGAGDYQLVFDEDLTEELSEQSHFSQQLFKMEFYKTNIAEYYFTIDSDMYFIRDFYYNSFVNEDETPYITIHECKDLLEYSYAIFGDNRIKQWFDGERLRIMDVFGRKGKTYDYSGSAILYCSEVFRGLYENYCVQNKLTFLDLLRYSASENTWYGEYILFSGFKYYPCNPMFKTFHYPWQYRQAKQLGITTEMLAENYLGITMNSNWNPPLTY